MENKSSSPSLSSNNPSPPLVSLLVVVVLTVDTVSDGMGSSGVPTSSVVDDYKQYSTLRFIQSVFCKHAYACMYVCVHACVCVHVSSCGYFTQST